MKNTLLILISLIFYNCIPKAISTNEKMTVISTLEYMNNIDQKYAGIPSSELREKYGNEKAWQIFKSKRDSVAIENQKKAKEILKKYGFIGTKNFNSKASGNFWVIVQHADNDIEFQEKYLKLMSKELKKGNAHKNEYALLEDRVNVNKGNKQRFGTQLTYSKMGQAIPVNGLTDSINIDKLRKEYNLPTFKDYYNHMTKDHYEMNEKIYKSQGILEPILYK